MYLALYRKYRPRTFDDVISQDHITITLKNQIAGGSAGHAYLFTGSRGTGKTSCAKIFAMAINCKNPQNGNPCLECDCCREILDGSATDIVEMDAASNNGVEDVRQLRDEVNYTPVSCKFRVYIIDEVHMLSNAAFNALLKTLEEPPPHVKFILATTELHKVPATIVSRCQRFEFRRIDAADSAKRLQYAAECEGISLDRDAAELIARLSDGGMRDALSVLDRCISADKHVTSEIVRSCAGVADKKHLFAFSEMIAAKNVSGCLRLLSELYQNSKDVALVIDELAEHFRDLMLCKSAPDCLDLLSALPDEYEKIKTAAESFTLGEILRCLTLMQQCADSIGKTRQRKIAAEMCFVKMCASAEAAGAETVTRVVSMKPEMRVTELPKEDFVPTPPEKMSRENLINISRLRAIGEETAKVVNQPSGSPEPPEPPQAPEFPEAPEPAEAPPLAEIPSAEIPSAEPVSEDIPKPEAESAAPENIPDSISADEWKNAVARCEDQMIKSMLADSSAEISDGVLVIRSPSIMLEKQAKDGELDELRKEIHAALGYSVPLRIEKNESAESSEENESKINRLLKKAQQLGIEIKQD